MGKRIFAGNKAICWNARYGGFEDSEDILKGKKPLETPGGKAKTELRGKCFHITLFDVLCTVFKTQNQFIDSRKLMVGK